MRELASMTELLIVIDFQIQKKNFTVMVLVF